MGLLQKQNQSNTYSGILSFKTNWKTVLINHGIYIRSFERDNEGEIIQNPVAEIEETDCHFYDLDIK